VFPGNRTTGDRSWRKKLTGPAHSIVKQGPRTNDQHTIVTRDGPHKLSVGGAISDAFWILSAQPFRLIGLMVTFSVLQAIPGMLLSGLEFFGAISDVGGRGFQDFAYIGGWNVIALLAILVTTTTLYGGLCAVILDAVRDKPVTIRRFFAGCKHIVPLLVYGLIVLVIMALAIFATMAAANKVVGTWALIAYVPSIVLAAGLIQGPFFIVDADMGAFEAFKHSIISATRLGWIRVFITLIILLLLIFLVVGTASLVALLGGQAVIDALSHLGSETLFTVISVAWLIPELLISSVSGIISVAVFAAMYQQATSAPQNAAENTP